jgi:hypothetical protein
VTRERLRCAGWASGSDCVDEVMREKVAQALANPFRWDAYVVVCAFSAEGHRVRLSGHRWKKSPRAEA